MFAPRKTSQTGSVSGSLFSNNRDALEVAQPEDPLQPLRAMADRVGKEVEEFAMRVDQWYTQGNETEKAKYRSTLHMVDKFKALADATVDGLRDLNEAENRGELQKSVRRRIKSMAEEKNQQTRQTDLARSFQSSIHPSVEASSAPPSGRVQTLRAWETEAATWDLLRVIIEHYHPEPGTDPAAEKQSQLAELGAEDRYSPNSDIWDRFLLEDDKAKEKELVLRWLERTAQNSESELDFITEQLENESGKGTNTWTSGWLDTKTRIKQIKRQTGKGEPLSTDYAGLRTKDGTSELVTQLDPDAPARQKRALEKPDEYYERALWMVCYEMMRRGVSWEEIREWCKDRSEGWRGISLGVAAKDHPAGVPNLSGPTVGYLFRRMCFYAAKGAQTQYESAVYGLLSGDLKEVEPVCRSWDDHLYARYNALLLSRFDSYLMQNYAPRLSQVVNKFVSPKAVDSMSSWETASVEVINILKQQKSTSAWSEMPLKLVQSSLIGGSMKELIYKVGVAITTLLQNDRRTTKLVIDSHSASSLTHKTEQYHQNVVSDPSGLRVLVHMFIALRNGFGIFRGESDGERAALDNVIVAYIEMLRLSKRMELIPLYAAQLDEERRYHCLARILPDIRNADEQKTFIALMRQYNIDPLRVARDNFTLTAENFKKDTKATRVSRFTMLEPTPESDYLWPGKRVSSSFDGMRVEETDMPMIETLQWHAHLDKEIENTFDVLQSGLFKLLLAGRIGAAIEVINNLNLESLSAMKTQALCGYAFDFMTPGTEIQDDSELPQTRRQSLRPIHNPTPEEHAEIVFRLRKEAHNYWDAQQLVRLIMLLREWREEEDVIIPIKTSGAKISTKRIKSLFESLTLTILPLIDEFFDDLPDTPDHDAYHVKRAFLPECILAYISAVQAYSHFTSRDYMTRAMDIAVLVAEKHREWLQKVLVQSGRLSEMVDMLAVVSRAMLRLAEADSVKKGRAVSGKLGPKGETLRIWDLNSRN